MMDTMCLATPADTTDTAMRVYLVLESNPLIAADLIGTLEAAFTCRVVHARSAARIPEALADIRAVTAAFLEMRAEELDQSGMGRFLRARGAQLILTCDEPEGDDAPLAPPQPERVTLLARPFTDTMVLASLENAPAPDGPAAAH